MSKHDPLSHQLDEIISAVLEPMESVDIINVPLVSDAVDKHIDPGQQSPALKAYCSRMHIRSRVRQSLAKRNDPIEKAGQYIQGERDDLFDGLLQQRYPVKRQGDTGYALRDVLTEVDVAYNSSRMRKAGGALLQHADALDAWFKSKV